MARPKRRLTPRDDAYRKRPENDAGMVAFVSHEEREAFKAMARRQGLTVTGLMSFLVQNYVEQDQLAREYRDELARQKPKPAPAVVPPAVSPPAAPAWMAAGT